MVIHTDITDIMSHTADYQGKDKPEQQKSEKKPGMKVIDHESGMSFLGILL
jgi:hypothetical protein